MDLAQSPTLLRGLQMLALAQAYFRHRNPRRRAIGRHHVAFYDRIWREAAERLGASCEGLDDGISEIALGAVRTRVFENTCALDDPVTLAVLAHKPLTHRLLAREGLPVPRHVEFDLTRMAPAVAFLESSRGDCVVKPAGGTGGGRGVTTGIRRRWQLAGAAASAAIYGDSLLIEEQVEGDNYRLLYLDGELIDAFVRRSPTVVADGRSTVSRLVRRANDERLRQRTGVSQVLLTVDLDMGRTLAKQGLSLRSVPPAGTVVTLKTVVNENRGADNATATHLLCDAIVRDGARAVRSLRVRLAGIDLITRDPRVPLAESGGAILEVNAPPNFYFHYQKSDASFPVAHHVLGRLLLDLRGPGPVPDRAEFDGAEASQRESCGS